MSSRTILVVDDDVFTLKLIRFVLQNHGMSVAEYEYGRDAIDYISHHKIDAAILDLGLPDVGGLEILKAIRLSPSINQIPVLILTNNNDKMDTVLALEMGADDYISKPFNQRELVARLNVGFRRMGQNNTNPVSCISIGDLFIDMEKREVKKSGETLQLTFKEFELLYILASNSGKVFSRDELLSKLWSDNYFSETRVIDMHITALRRKLGDTLENNSYIETVRGIGYRFRK